MKNSCSQSSFDSQEPLWGTAPTYENFILMETPLPWHEEASQSSSIPESIRKMEEQWKKEKKSWRIQLIAKESTNPKGPFSIYFYHLHGIASTMGEEYKVENLEEIHNFLKTSISKAFTRTVVHQKTLLVCTHGSRDQCCGKAGYALYEALEKKIQKKGLHWKIWRTSHVGGHRFAANVLVFPEGRLYGRLGMEEVDSFLESLEKNEVFSSHCRGLSLLSPEAQVAELFGWEQSREYKNISRIEVEKKENVFHLSLKSKEKIEARYQVQIGLSGQVYETYFSCTDSEKKKVQPFVVLSSKKEK